MDDILFIYHNADCVLQCLHQSFLITLRYDNQDMYLHTKLEYRHGQCEAVRNCEPYRGADYSDKFRSPMRAKDFFAMGCDLEIDVSSELRPGASSYFQSII